MKGIYPNSLISIDDTCQNSGEVPGKNLGKDGDGGKPEDNTYGEDDPKGCPVAVSEAGSPVNVTTGNMRYEASPDIAVRGRTLSINLSRTYNSRDDVDRNLGIGWSGFSRSTLVDDGFFVNIRGEDGKAHYFAKLSDGSYQHVYSNTHGTLEGDDQTGYTWRYENTFYEFLPDGKLAQVTSPTGDYMIFTHDPVTGLETRITLQNGGGIEMTYDANQRMEKIFLLDNTGTPLSLPARAFSYQTVGIGHYLATKVRNGSGQLIEEYIYDDMESPGVYRNFPPNLTEVRRYTDGINYVVAETHTYDKEDRAITSAAGGGSLSRTFDYSVAEQTTVTDSLGRQQVFTFDGPWEVTSITGTGCSECGSDYASFTYDHYGNVISAVDRRGYIMSINRDSRGNVLTRTEAADTAEERTTVYEYHPDYDLVTKETTESVLSPGNNKIITYDYHNAQGNTTPYLYAVINEGYTYSAGAVVQYHYETLYSYNIYGQVTSIDGPRTDVADTTTFIYDVFTGDLMSVTDPVGNTTSFSNYDLRGNPSVINDANNVATYFSYDSEGRIVSVSRPSTGEVTSYSYYFPAGSNLLDAVTLPGGNTLTLGYDDALTLISITDGLGNTITYSYDLEGNRIYEEVRDAGNVLRRDVQYIYDGLDRLWQVIEDPSSPGVYTEYGYDANGNRDLAVSPDGRRVDYTFDALNRLDTAVREMGALDETTNYGYDSADNLTSVTDANGNTTYYTYDDAGRLVHTSSPDTGMTKYSYDAAGNLVYKEDARGEITRYVYDAANRLTNVTYDSDPSLDVTYEYDLPTSANGLGRLCRMTDSSGATVYHHSAAGMVSEEMHTIMGIDYSTTYSYYSNGMLGSVTSPTGRYTVFNRDFTGVITSAHSALDGNLDWIISDTTPNPLGGYDSITYGNGVVNNFTYDLDGSLSTLASGSFLSRSYQRLAGGDIYQINDLVNPLSYDYDLAGRLTLGTGSFGSVSYTYDGVGNRLTKVTGAGSTAYSYVPGTNQLASATGPESASFIHDPTGNMTVDGALSTVYNAAGRIFEITDGSTLKGRYFYNGQGQRVVKDECRVFVYDLSGNLIGEYLTDGTMVAEFVYADGMRVAEYRDVNRDPVCTPSQEPPGPAEGFALSNDPAYTPTTSVYFNAETLYSLVWSDQIDESQVTESSANLQGAKGVKGNYTLSWDPACSGWTGSYDLSLLNIAKGGNTWEWSATITDALGGSYTPTATLTITEGSAMSSFGAGGGNTILTAENPLATSAAGNFKYPRIYSVDPPSGSTWGAETVTIHGDWFDETAVVEFETHYMDPTHMSPLVTYVDRYTLLAMTPPHEEGLVDVAVHKLEATDPNIWGGTWGEDLFTFITPTQSADVRLHFFHNDHLGTPLYLTDASSIVVWEGQYWPFGDIYTQDTDPDLDGAHVYQPFRFPGQVEDFETGLYYNYFRDYDPTIGRYVEADPIGLAGGMNVYNYSAGNPVSNTDPHGLTWTSNAAFLADWLLGLGSNVRTYGQDAVETQEMAGSPGGMSIREQFYLRGCRTQIGLYYPSGRAARETALNPLGWWSTAFQVGGFAGAQAINNGDGTVTFIIPNTAGMNSFFYHILPNRKGSTGPMSNVKQTFQWTEKIDECRCQNAQ